MFKSYVRHCSRGRKFLVITMAVAMALVMIACTTKPSDAAALQKSAEEAYAKATQMIKGKDEFRDTKIKFPALEPQFVRQTGSDDFEISSFLELEQGEKSVKKEYYAKLRRNGMNWALVEFRLSQ